MFLTKISLFFKSITIQLLDGAEEKGRNLYAKEVLFRGFDGDGTFHFVAEMFTRICRRGSAGKTNSTDLMDYLTCFELCFFLLMTVPQN